MRELRGHLYSTKYAIAAAAGLSPQSVRGDIEDDVVSPR